MILGLGIPELALILVVVLIIFGPKNLPKLGKSMGSTVKNFREGLEDAAAPKDEAEVEDVEDADSDSDSQADDAKKSE